MRAQHAVPEIKDVSLHSHTPTLSVFDPRGLAMEEILKHRCNIGRFKLPDDTLVTLDDVFPATLV